MIYTWDTTIHLNFEPCTEILLTSTVISVKIQTNPNWYTYTKHTYTTIIDETFDLSFIWSIYITCFSIPCVNSFHNLDLAFWPNNWNDKLIALQAYICESVVYVVNIIHWISLEDQMDQEGNLYLAQLAS